MIHKIICYFCLILGIIHLQSYSQEKNAEEALFIRRILELWKEKDHSLLRSQIRQFFIHYPHSSSLENLTVILADSYWEDEQYTEALSLYETISHESLKTQVLGKKLDCLINLNQYQMFVDELDPYLSETSSNFIEEDWILFYAEASTYLAYLNADESNEYFEKAQKAYQSLLKGKLAYEARLGLAKVFEAIHSYSDAADYYLTLAKEGPADKSEEFFFHAGRMQVFFDPEKALATLGVLQEKKGKLAVESGLLRLKLLASQERFKEIVDAEDSFAILLKEHSLYTHYILGKSHSHLQNDQVAIAHLQPLVDLFLESPTQCSKLNVKNLISLLLKSFLKLDQLNTTEEYLLVFYKKTPELLTLEQKQWLSHHLYKKIIQQSYSHEKKMENAEICLKLLQEKTIDQSVDEILKNETVIDQLSTLYQVLGKLNEEEELLQLVIKVQDTQNAQAGKMREKALLSFAKIKEQKKELALAQEFYKKILLTKDVSSENKALAKLKIARLSFALLPEEEKYLGQPQMEEMLVILKDLQIHKVMKQEPVHLEAALDYAWMRASLEPVTNREKFYLALLEKAKRDFSCSPDIYSQNYYDSFSLSAEKKAIYESYLLLMDAKITETQSHLADAQDQEIYLSNAQKLYQQLRANDSVTDYIKREIEICQH